jgi:hypothetical protein
VLPISEKEERAKEKSDLRGSDLLLVRTTLDAEKDGILIEC